MWYRCTCRKRRSALPREMNFARGFRLIFFFIFAVNVATADEHASDTIADVLELIGSGGTAGEPRRHELQVGAKLYTNKLVMLDRGALLVVRYSTDQTIYEFRGPALIVMHRDGPLVVEGEKAVKRAIN